MWCTLVLWGLNGFKQTFELLLVIIWTKITTKCFLLIQKLLGTHVIVLYRTLKFAFLAAHVRDKYRHTPLYVVRYKHLNVSFNNSYV